MYCSKLRAGLSSLSFMLMIPIANVSFQLKNDLTCRYESVTIVNMTYRYE